MLLFKGPCFGILAHKWEDHIRNMLQCNAIEKTFKAHHCDALVTPYHTVQNTCLALRARHSYLNLVLGLVSVRHKVRKSTFLDPPRSATSPSPVPSGSPSARKSSCVVVAHKSSAELLLLLSSCVVVAVVAHTFSAERWSRSQLSDLDDLAKRFPELDGLDCSCFRDALERSARTWRTGSWARSGDSCWCCWGCW